MDDEHCQTKFDDAVLKQNRNEKIAPLDVYCTNRENGCSWTGPLDSLVEHVTECTLDSLILYSDLEILEELPPGFYADVYKVQYKPTGQNMILKFNRQPQDERFLKQMKLLRNLHHPNIIRWFGVCRHKDRICPLMEELNGGTLKLLLQRSTSSELPWELRIQLSSDIAQGMEYLHKYRVVHRDLCTRNVMLRKHNSKYTAVVTEFALARKLLHGSKLKEPARTPYLIAPETSRGEPFDETIDVYFFGVILYEIISPQDPRTFAAMKSVDEVVETANVVCHRRFVKLAYDCCKSIPAERPSFTQIVIDLDQLDLNDQTKGGNPETSVVNAKHLQAYEQALCDGIVLNMRYLKFLFVGPPESGKSSARKRLVQEIINLRALGKPTTSTRMAEANEVLIKKLTSSQATIVNSHWCSLKKPTISQRQGGDLSYLAQVFYRLIAAASSTLISPTTSIDKLDQPGSELEINAVPQKEKGVTIPQDLPNKSDPKATLQVEAIKNEVPTEIDDAFKSLMTIIQSDNPEELQNLLDNLTLINMKDTGGQPAFLEMLPALTVGPALYMFFFRLDQELNKRYKVCFRSTETGNKTLLESSYSIENCLYQTLSSIACFGSYNPENQPDSEPELQVSSRVLLFGTYKDQVDDSHIFKVEKTLKEHLVNTKLYKEDLLLKTVQGKLFFPIDNMDGDETEMNEIRKDIENIINHFFPPVPIPASWLMFRILLHLLHKRVVSLSQCEQIAKRLSMTTPVQEALWFFHRNIGCLLYYPEVSSLQNTVICDPQVVFDSVSELIIDTFKISNRRIPQSVLDDFHEKGQFSLTHIRDTTGPRRSEALSLKQLIDLLKHLNILAEITPHEDGPDTSYCQPKYIMPAVFKDGALEIDQLPCALDSALQASSLMIHFEFGFVPFGIFCGMLAYLISRQDSLSPRWSLCDKKLLKNRVTFTVDRAYITTLISHPQYIELQVSKHPRAYSKHSLSEICSVVRQTVVETLETVLSNMTYRPYARIKTALFHSKKPFDLAFICCLEDTHSNHLMKVIKDTEGLHLECLKESVLMNLDEKHQIWFCDANGTKVEATTLSECDHPLEIGDLCSIVNKVWNARIKWYFLGLVLDVHPSTLDTIKVRCNGDPDCCFQEMLMEWLKKSDPKPTWGCLIQALRFPSVNFVDLADQLQSKLNS